MNKENCEADIVEFFDDDITPTPVEKWIGIYQSIGVGVSGSAIVAAKWNSKRNEDCDSVAIIRQYAEENLLTITAMLPQVLPIGGFDSAPATAIDFCRKYDMSLSDEDIARFQRLMDETGAERERVAKLRSANKNRQPEEKKSLSTMRKPAGN